MKIITSYSNNKVVFLLLILSFLAAQHSCAADPTDGFTRVRLTQGNLKLQKPYDKGPHERYSKVGGVEKFWIHTNDKPFKQHSRTRPRTEIRISGHDYTSKVWQFEGNFFVPQGTSGVTIMQVFGAAHQATTMQLRVYDGDLMYYRKNVEAGNIYNKWIRLNVIHNVGAGKVTIFINGDKKLVVNGHGRAKFYFKYGVYVALYRSSSYMESRWKGVKLFKQ